MFQMFRNIIRNFFSRPATRKYPFEKREPFDNVRGRIDIEINDCILCGICERKCPANAIDVNKQDKSWQINNFKCILCNVCVESCPKKCIYSGSHYKVPETEKSFMIHKKEESQDA